MLISPKILLIDDDVSTIDFVGFSLRKRGYAVTSATLAGDGIKAAETDKFDVVLLDLRLPDMNGLDALQKIKEISPETEVIVFSGYATLEVAVEATKFGAFYFVEKPLDMDRLTVLLEKALELGGKSKEIKQLRSKLSTRSTYDQIVGSSKPMQDIFEIIDSVASSDANILVLGESGTGKELIANAVHFHSLRAKKPFVKVNCAALPKDLIESELFGHTKGSFTGATADKNGLIAQAHGGSLLLDEIGEMPIELQPKLLRVLQERVYSKVGGDKPQAADFRLICSTNRDPLKAVEEGKLREDLYFRINTIALEVPPLRERSEDIQRLAEHFLRIFAKKYNRPVKNISPEAYSQIFAHGWQGNVRELQNVMERAVLLCKSETIEASNLPFGGNSNRQNVSAVETKMNVDEVKCSVNALTFEQIGELIVDKIPEPTRDTNLNDVFEELEANIVKAALSRSKGNKQATANLLGVYRPRLYNMLKKHGL
jgi:two-component system, NtrC family, response regulator AtoC